MGLSIDMGSFQIRHIQQIAVTLQESSEVIHL
jgi:hypothetical protein